MVFKSLIFGMVVAGSILCLGFFFGLRRSRVRERLQLEIKEESAQSRSKDNDDGPLDIEFLPKELVDKVEDKLGLKSGSPKINELKKSLIQAGIYHRKAPSIYFGLKLGLSVALPVLGMPWLFGRGIAAIFLLAIFFGLVVLGYFIPTLFLSHLVQTRQKKIKEGEAAERQLPQFMEEVARLELELDKLLRILPSQRRTEDLLRRIRSLTEQGDFLLVRFSPRAITPQDDFYSEWPIQIELEGTYHNLALFFDRISRFSRIVNVENLKITPHSSKGGDHHTIKATFTAKTFLSIDDTEGES